MHQQRLQFLVPHSGLADSASDVNQLAVEDVGFTHQEGRLLSLSSSVDMENTITVGCAGVILTHLQRRRTSELGLNDHHRQDGGSWRVKAVEMFSLKETM